MPRARRIGPRPALDGARRGRASRRRHDHGLEQSLPAWANGRLRNSPSDRRRAARDHGRRRADGPWGARAIGAAPVARMDRAGLRGSRRRPVPAGIDGEAVRLEPPLRFSIRTGSFEFASRLSIRVPRRRRSSRGSVDSVRTLARIVAGRGPDSNEDEQGDLMDIVEIQQKKRSAARRSRPGCQSCQSCSPRATKSSSSRAVRR